MDFCEILGMVHFDTNNTWLGFLEDVGLGLCVSRSFFHRCLIVPPWCIGVQ